jgi:hypothetical protein
MSAYYNQRAKSIPDASQTKQQDVPITSILPIEPPNANHLKLMKLSSAQEFIPKRYYGQNSGPMVIRDPFKKIDVKYVIPGPNDFNKNQLELSKLSYAPPSFKVVGMRNPEVVNRDFLLMRQKQEAEISKKKEDQIMKVLVRDFASIFKLNKERVLEHLSPESVNLLINAGEVTKGNKISDTMVHLLNSLSLDVLSKKMDSILNNRASPSSLLEKAPPQTVMRDVAKEGWSDAGLPPHQTTREMQKESSASSSLIELARYVDEMNDRAHEHVNSNINDVHTILEILKDKQELLVSTSALTADQTQILSEAIKIINSRLDDIQGVVDSYFLYTDKSEDDPKTVEKEIASKVDDFTKKVDNIRGETIRIMNSVEPIMQSVFPTITPVNVGEAQGHTQSISRPQFTSASSSSSSVPSAVSKPIVQEASNTGLPSVMDISTFDLSEPATQIILDPTQTPSTIQSPFAIQTASPIQPQAQPQAQPVVLTQKNFDELNGRIQTMVTYNPNVNTSNLNKQQQKAFDDKIIEMKRIQDEIKRRRQIILNNLKTRKQDKYDELFSLMKDIEPVYNGIKSMVLEINPPKQVKSATKAPTVVRQKGRGIYDIMRKKKC